MSNAVLSSTKRMRGDRTATRATRALRFVQSGAACTSRRATAPSASGAAAATPISVEKTSAASAANGALAEVIAGI
jgi:hypothetical protein